MKNRIALNGLLESLSVYCVILTEAEAIFKNSLIRNKSRRFRILLHDEVLMCRINNIHVRDHLLL